MSASEGASSKGGGAAASKSRSKASKAPSKAPSRAVSSQTEALLALSRDEGVAASRAAGLSHSDAHWMELAFEQASEAYSAAEVPVGCVFVGRWEEPQDSSSQPPEEVELGRGRNEVNESRNPTRHAEMVALEGMSAECSRRGLGLADLLRRSTLFVSVEPCGMCAGALSRLRLRRVVFGCSNPRFGGLGGVIDVSAKLHPEMQRTSGVQKERAVAWLRRFYARENLAAPPEKRKRKEGQPQTPPRHTEPTPDTDPSTTAQS